MNIIDTDPWLMIGIMMALPFLPWILAGWYLFLFDREEDDDRDCY